MAVVDPTVFLCFVTLLVVELGTFSPYIKPEHRYEGKTTLADNVYSVGVVDVVERRQTP